MQEIAKNIYIETEFAGVDLGVIKCPHGLVLIDSPFRIEEIRLWRLALMTFGGEIERLLITLDSHIDRTLGVKAMECTVIGHERLANAYRTRPITLKAQGLDAGAEWELCEGVSPVRWNPPDICFSDGMTINCGDHAINLQYRPGPTGDAIWVDLPGEKTIFIGDFVLINEPPFLGQCDLSSWIDNLKVLLRQDYSDYLFVSGRSGLVTHTDIQHQIEYLEQISSSINAHGSSPMTPLEIEQMISSLLNQIKVDKYIASHFETRLRSGLFELLIRKSRPDAVETYHSGTL